MFTVQCQGTGMTASGQKRNIKLRQFLPKGRIDVDVRESSVVELKLIT